MTTADALELDAGFTSGFNRFCKSFRASAVPAAALTRSIDAITDTLGCTVLGARQPLERRLRRGLFGAASRSDIARLLAPAALAAANTDAQGAAALYMGTLAHAADFDDISHPAYCHATALLLPALLVRATIIGASGTDLIRAHIAGLETLGQLGRRLNTGHYERGWHTTGTFGAIGATAALCFLEGFSDEATQCALGIAASLSSGVRQNFGTMTKPLHAGLAGRSAILATRLAAADFTSAEDAIEGKYGFMKVFGGAADEHNRKNWGEPLEILTEAGIGLKAYPCCAATHPAIDAARALRRAIEGFRVDDIEAVRVGASRFAMEPLIHDNPRTSLEGKFSMRYCVAAALLDGSVNVRSFLEENIARPAIAAVMSRMRVAVDERVAEDHEFAAIVELSMKSGRTESVRIDVASGKPGNWLSAELLKEKFSDCVGGVGDAAGRSEALYDCARALGRAGPVAALQAALANSIESATAAAG